MLKSWNEMRGLDISKYVKQRDKADYLPWASCLKLLYENGAEKVSFRPLVNENGSSLFMSDQVFTDKSGGTNRCYEVRVEVVIDGYAFGISYPVMNGINAVRDIELNRDGALTLIRRIDLGCGNASQQTGEEKLSDEELAVIYNALPNATDGTLRFTLRTYSDPDYTNQVGDANFKEIALSVPNDSATKPSVTMELTSESSIPEAFAGLYIQGKAKVKAALSAEPKYGAEVVSCSVKVDGKEYGPEQQYTSDYLNNSGNITVTGAATDSRGCTGQAEKTITVIAYSKPKLLPASGESEVVAARCDARGNLTDSGTYLKIKARCQYREVNRKLDVLFLADRTILYDRIKHLGKSYIARSWISVEELEDLTNMHKVYHDKDKLNGNGFLDELMKTVNHLEKR